MIVNFNFLSTFPFELIKWLLNPVAFSINDSFVIVPTVAFDASVFSTASGVVSSCAFCVGVDDWVVVLDWFSVDAVGAWLCGIIWLL